MVPGVISHGNLDSRIYAVVDNCPHAAEPIQPFVSRSRFLRQQPGGVQNSTWAVVPDVDLK